MDDEIKKIVCMIKELDDLAYEYTHNVSDNTIRLTLT